MDIFPTMAFYSNFIQWMERHLLICPSKKFLHIDCPGCGLQRSMIALLKGDLVSSLQFYPATIPILSTMLFLILHLRNQYQNGALILTRLYVFCMAIILINYVYKIATLQIVAP
jgi:hypothetical protein